MAVKLFAEKAEVWGKGVGALCEAKDLNCDSVVLALACVSIRNSSFTVSFYIRFILGFWFSFLCLIPLAKYGKNTSKLHANPKQRLLVCDFS